MGSGAQMHFKFAKKDSTEDAWTDEKLLDTEADYISDCKKLPE
jgi:hypothetical protein